MTTADPQQTRTLLAGREARFGPFRLIPARQLLLADDEMLPLGARAYEVLQALVESAGELVDKETLIAKAWPNTHVDESNLRTAIAALRRALGETGSAGRYIATMPGRGYRFVAPVSISEIVDARRSLPAPLAPVIGLEDAIAAVRAELGGRRLVTIVGPGGVGKTTLALEVARLAIEHKEFSAASVIDLAHLEAPDLILQAVQSGLGIGGPAGEELNAIAAHLSDQRQLIVLDSCEPLLAANAAAAEAILAAAPDVVVLATSREPLRAQGERIWRLDPLSAPPPYASYDATGALGYPAVELFCERAAASSTGFALTDPITDDVCEICRRLDGLPLAIELAAGRLDVLDVPTLAAELSDHFRLHMPGRSSGLPRHRTLEAALDWSFESLSDRERLLLRRLAVFRGPFGYDAARAVVADAELPAVEVSSGLAALAAKSLIMRGSDVAIGSNRLLDTTRAYALCRLMRSGEADVIKARHARYFERLVRDRASCAETKDGATWFSFCSQTIDQVRAALEWAMSEPVDADLAASLTAAARPLWRALGLADESLAEISHP